MDMASPAVGCPEVEAAPNRLHRRSQCCRLVYHRAVRSVGRRRRAGCPRPVVMKKNHVQCCGREGESQRRQQTFCKIAHTEGETEAQLVNAARLVAAIRPQFQRSNNFVTALLLSVEGPLRARTKRKLAGGVEPRAAVSARGNGWSGHVTHGIRRVRPAR